ncbi:MAG TPA: MFS transporter [Rhizomicrobium sp.]|nr:MFS transporter [Rhizomicrobium sp.]
MPLAALRGLTKAQKHVIAASYLGWMLDAFDFFLLVFVMTDVAKEFDVSVKDVSWAVTLTLALRPVGAFIFGRLADRYGRRPVMMIDVLLYASLAFASGFAPSLTVFLILRALFGIAMGGEWGVGASLTMESIPPQARGVVSGILQAGYPSGYLVASIAYGILFPLVGWRGMFMVGLAPALLVLYIRNQVPESPGWDKNRNDTHKIMDVLRKHWRLAIYAILFMTGMNFLSHGTQDLYPTFLKVDRGFNPHAVSIIVVIYNIGAIAGGLTFGSISQFFGRRRTLILGALISLPLIPFWAFSTNIYLLALAAFIVQFMVQGCWGIIPAHLNELSPPEARGTFPGVVYQLGNFFASYNATFQAGMAVSYGSYGAALAFVAAIAAVAIAVLAMMGQEAKEVDMAASAQPART